MQPNEPTLEAEVVEIDGVAVEPRSEMNRPEPQKNRRVVWQSLEGKIRVLDKRWAPLWIILGIIAVILAVIVGLILAVFAFAFWIVKSILRAVMSIFT